MDCRSCEKLINEYLDGELSKREEKKFQKHLAKCPTCKNEFDSYMFINDQLAGVEELSPSEGFEAGILSQLQPYKAYGVMRSQAVANSQDIANNQAAAISQDIENNEEIASNQTIANNRNVAAYKKVSVQSKGQRGTTGKEIEEVQQRDRLKDFILIFGYFITLFVVLGVLRNAVFQNTEWISGILVTGRVFREVFDGVIFRGVLSLLVVYPIRIFHWARMNFSQMSFGGRMMYSLVVLNLILIITFSHIMLGKLAKGRGKNKGGNSDEIQHSRT